ncbi:MAG: glycosyltransferase family 2 protein [Bacteroidales bacterium]|nr:glycosyltransferase family 2 protein [Bacteroidales bacterium]
MESGISVVICCYNSEKRIPIVLDWLQKQKYHDSIVWEVVLVDNASNDKTVSVARDQWKLDMIDLRIVYESNPGISHARMRGFAEAKYEIVSFVDDDNWVETGWIQKIFDTMYSNSDIGILGGQGIASFEENPPEWFYTHQSSYAVGPQAKESGEHNSILYGAGLNIRKSSWEFLMENGFTFQLTGRKGKSISSGEDSELCLAVLLSGRKLYYRADLQFYHFMPAARIEWEYLVKLTKSFGRSGPVHDIYFSILRDYKGLDRLKYQYRFLSLLRSVYDNFLFIPWYMKLLFSKKQGNNDHLKSAYLWNSLKEKIRLYRRFPSMVTEIRNGAWKIKT